MGKITPFLWFDGRLDEAIAFYRAVFKDVVVLDQNPMTARFVIEGQEFMALNGGPAYTFNEAISFFISCETQAEVDDFWEALCADGGRPGACGWLKDKFGVSWQVVPTALGRLLGGGDRAAAGRVMAALRSMGKIIISELDAAADAV